MWEVVTIGDKLVGWNGRQLFEYVDGVWHPLSIIDEIKQDKETDEMALAKIKRTDRVIVLTGKDKGKSGEVIKYDPKTGMATVRTINKHFKHQKQTVTMAGGIHEREAPIHVSNLALADPESGKPTRMAMRINHESGERERYAKRSGVCPD